MRDGSRLTKMGAFRRLVLWGAVILLAAGAAGLAAWAGFRYLRAGPSGRLETSAPSQGELEKLGVYGRVPDFELTERSGKRITLSGFLGKVWIANFFYTECTDTCPLQSAHMAQLQADLTDPDIRLVSISVDPEHDTPEVLSEYATRFRADPDRWLFLTGRRDAIYRLASEGFRLGVVDSGEKAQRETGGDQARFGPASAWAHPFPNPARKPLIHSSRFVLVDQQAQIRGYYHGTDPESLERLRQNVRILAREKPN